MKTPLLFSLALLLSGFVSRAQIVNIPDANFKNILLNDIFINQNGDSEIQLSEARAATGILAINANISDMTGLEAFINLDILWCYGNNITTLDLSNNTKLTALRAQDNQITSLILPTNIDTLRTVECQNNRISNGLDFSTADILESLNCSYNQIPSIDFPSSNALNDIQCQHNMLTRLSISYPPYQMDCGNNPMDSLWVLGTVVISTIQHTLKCDSSQLVYIDYNGQIDTLIASHNNLEEISFFNSIDLDYLDLSYNNFDTLYLSRAVTDFLVNNNQLNLLRYSGDPAAVSNFDARNNPSLGCIAFDNAGYATYASNNWTNVDPGMVYGTASTCQPIWMTIERPAFIISELYPNPTEGDVYLELDRIYDNIELDVYNSTGQLVVSKILQQVQSHILELPEVKGLYFVVLKTNDEQQIFKVVRQ